MKRPDPPDPARWAAQWGTEFKVKPAWHNTSQAVMLPDGSTVTRSRLLSMQRCGVVEFSDLRPGAVVRVVM